MPAKRKAHTRRKPEGLPSRKGRPPAKTSGRRSEVLKVRWETPRPAVDIQGEALKRHYRIETLAGATEKLMRERDSFIQPSIQQALGPSRLVSLVFELVQESRYRLVFKLRAANAKRRLGTFGFVVAKNAQEFSVLAAAEYANLGLIGGRAPNRVVKPLKMGKVFLPDRYRRKEHGREITAYMTRWPGGYHELGVGRDGRFLARTTVPFHFSGPATQELKAGIVETLARAYDPKQQSGIDLSRLAPGDFAATRPKRGAPRIKLTACRRTVNRISPAKLINAIVAAQWDWGARSIRLAPDDPERLISAFVSAAGESTAYGWLRAYRKGLSAGRFPRRPPLSQKVLAATLKKEP